MFTDIEHTDMDMKTFDPFENFRVLIILRKTGYPRADMVKNRRIQTNTDITKKFNWIRLLKSVTVNMPS